MARGFGTNFGVNNADIITTPLTAHSANRSWSMWLYRGPAQVGGRPLWKGVEQLFEDSGDLIFSRSFTNDDGEWAVTVPDTEEWFHLCITYNSSSTANNPLIYINGSSQTVTENNTPNGTAETNATAYTIGNRSSDNARVWDGMIAEVAIYNRILSGAEVSFLAGGGDPRSVSGADPLVYYGLCGSASPEPDAMGGSSATVSGTASQAHPPGVSGVCAISGNPWYHYAQQ